MDGSAPQVRQSSNSDAPELVVFSSCDCQKFSSLFSSFSTGKASILSSIGFAGLLKLPVHEKLNDSLSLWLYNRFDHINMCLHLDGGVKLPLRDLDVHLIFSIPFQGRTVDYSNLQSKENVDAFLGKIVGDSISSSLTMSFLEHILSNDCGPDSTPAEIDAFKIASVLCSLHYLLAPEKNLHFPGTLIRNFLPDVNPVQFNWAEFVLSTLGRATVHAQEQIKEGNNKIALFGCTLLLQIFYLDNLNFGPSTPYHILLPRSSAYSPKLLNELVQSDCTGTSIHIFMEFGSRQVREASEVCYSRGWESHGNVHIGQEPACPEDFLETIQILSEGLQVVEEFASKVNQFKGTSQSVADALFQSARDSYQQVRYKFKENLHTLSTKAAAMLKRHIMIMYQRHNPIVLPSLSHKRFYTASSNQFVMKKTKCQTTSLAERMLLDAADVAPLRACPPHNLGLVPQYPSSSSVLQLVMPVTPQSKLVSTHSKFPLSCFDLSFNHPDVSRSRKTKSYAWISSELLRWDELNCDWILFTTPVALNLTGYVVHNCLKQNGHFSVPFVDAIMLLWSYLDDVVYSHFHSQGQIHQRWRHFLPASFTEIVLGHSGYLNANIIRSAFIGQHIGYDIENCQKIILPVCLSGTWSCYFWDFKWKTVTVLDPMLMGYEVVNASKKHGDTVTMLHKALFNCKDHFFSGWDISEYGWSHVYRTDLGRRCKLANSGIYAVHYARSFCGDKIVFNLKESSESNLSEARGEIIYHIFTCPHNKGYKPIRLMNEIGHDFY